MMRTNLKTNAPFETLHRKIFVSPIGIATPNDVYPQQAAKPASLENISTKISYLLLAQLPWTQFTHSTAPNPHARRDINAVLGAFRRGCGTSGRRWAATSVCVAGERFRACVLLACGFGAVLCISCIRGSRANRRYEIFALMVLLACGFGAVLWVNCVRGSCAIRRWENFALISSSMRVWCHRNRSHGQVATKRSATL